MSRALRRRSALIAGAPAAVAALAACGAAQGGEVLLSDPAHAVLALSDLGTPGFTTLEPPHTVTVTVCEAHSNTADQLRQNSLQLCAEARYFRYVDAALSNGPIDVSSSVESFPTATSAAAAFAGQAATLTHAAGAEPISAGLLGDDRVAVELSRPGPASLPLVQFSVLWRVADLVAEIVVRGRSGAVRVEDAVLLAQRQTARELTAG